MLGAAAPAAANPFSFAPPATKAATPSASGTSLFGAKPAGGGLFGATTPGAPATPTPAAGTSLFGAAAPAPAGGLFGAPAPAPAAGPFGAAAAPAHAAGLFGAAAAAPAPAGGLFGAPAPAAGLFGAPATPAAPATGGSLFGATTPAATTPGLATTPALGGSLFGATPATPAGGLFGGAAATTPAAGTGLLGASSATPAAGGGLFGAATPTPAATPGVAPTAPAMATDADVFQTFLRQMAQAWDANDYKQCSFKYVFYDDLSQEGPTGAMVPPPADVLARRRAETLGASDAGLWERADAANPDPSRFCPVQVTGFEALAARRAQQQQLAAKVSGLLEATHAKLRALADDREVALGLKLRHYRERQRELNHRVLKLATAVEAQRLRRANADAAPLSAHERKWRDQLEQVARVVRDPASGQVKLYELSLRAEQLQSTAGSLGELGVASRLNLDALGAWLASHQEGLQQLINVHRADAADAEVALKLYAAHGRNANGANGR